MPPDSVAESVRGDVAVVVVVGVGIVGVAVLSETSGAVVPPLSLSM